MLQTILQTMISVRSNNLSLKYQRFTTSSSKDIEVKIFDFVPKTQLLCLFRLIFTLLSFSVSHAYYHFFLLSILTSISLIFSQYSTFIILFPFLLFYLHYLFNFLCILPLLSIFLSQYPTFIILFPFSVS